MNNNIHISFKKEPDGSYIFNTIFIVPDGCKVPELDLPSKRLSFGTGLVCGVSNEDIEQLFRNNSSKVVLHTHQILDDNNDDYFSIFITSEQLSKWLPIFQLPNNNDEDNLLSLLAIIFKKCDGIDKINISRVSDDSIVSQIEFVEDRDNIRFRSSSFLKRVLNMTKSNKMSYNEEDNMATAIGLANSLGIQIEEFNPDTDDEYFDNNMDVEHIVSEVKKRVIAQDDAIESIVNNIYTNQKIIDSNNPDFIAAAKVNILLDGPTGTGKTLIVEQTAKQLSIPIVVRPIISFTTAGYKGADLTEMLTLLLEQADGNLALAERGIIALDEFDKLSYHADRGLEIKPALQQELLSYLGGGRQLIDYRGRRLTFDTSKITFIGFGSFDNLRERKIQEKKRQKMGFNVDSSLEDRTYTISIQDYIDEGIQKEIMGRFSLFTHTNALKHDDLVRIMNESIISPINALIETGKMFGVEIVISDEIISKIADLALEDGTGARGIKTIATNLRDLLLGKMISSRVDRVVVDEELLNKSRMKMVRSY